MTRRKWATDEQHAWLMEHFPAFLVANETKSASKTFYPEVVPAFREKWPVDPVTSEEIKDAGNADFAARVKREKYDQRTRSWFPNTARASLAGKPQPMMLLDVKTPTQPKRLQSWQAYHALTYEKQWKPHVDKAWDDYKTAWNAEHPDEKPPKTRLEIMSTFMKSKYEEADDEMKGACEKYRMEEASAKDASSSAQITNTVNAKYQAAIDKLPKSLASIGESLSLQTGWNVTIIAGGPSPGADGGMMSYISNTGKTKDGKSYQQFLGSKEYDEHIQLPYDRFLRACFTAQDCAVRSLTATADADNAHNHDTIDLESEEISNDSGPSGLSGRKSETKGKEKNVEKEQLTNRATPSANAIQRSEYEIAKEQNIEQLKEILTQLKEDFPILDDMKAKGKSEKPGRNKKKEGEEGEVVVERRQSSRLKELDSDNSGTSIPTGNDGGKTTDQDFTLPTNPATPDVAVAGTESVQISTTLPSSQIPLASASPSSPEKTTSSILLDVIATQPLDFIFPTLLPLPSNSDPDAHVIDPLPIIAPTCLPDSQTASEIATLSPLDSGPIPQEVPISPARPVSPTTPTLPLSSVSEPPVPKTPNVSPSTENQGNEDVEMNSVISHPASHRQNHADVPEWLNGMIDLMLTSSEDNVWHSLVNAFLAFEGTSPPAGHLPTKLRPKEITCWIKNKKKDTMPTIDPKEYSARFTTWWIQLQPSWRLMDQNRSLPLLREVPANETWRALRKGGRSGMYIVVFGLFWWVKAYSDDNSVMIDPSSVIDDVLWVFQQLNGGNASTGKRGHDDNPIDHNRPTKMRRISS